jgi:predicted phage terminase large subunit-like protein
LKKESNYQLERAILNEKLNRFNCEKSFMAFIFWFYPVLNSREPLIYNWHIGYIANILQAKFERLVNGLPREKHLIITIPPRSLKSSIVSVLFPAWCWTTHPELKFISSSYSGELSIEHNVACRRIIESDNYKAYWKIRITSDQNTKGKFENIAGGFRKSTSTGGTITGQGGNVIIIDDPVNPKQVASEVERKSANDHFDFTLSTRLNNTENDLFIIVMQRIHEDDLVGHVISKNPNRWELISIPVDTEGSITPPELVANYKDGLMFPERYSKEYINNMQITMGSYQFACQYRMITAPPEGGILKRRYFQILSELPRNEKNEPLPLIWKFTVDGAYTEKTQNDPSAILSFAEWNNNIIIRNVESVWKEFPDLMEYIVYFCTNNGYEKSSAVYIEPKASGQSAVQTLKKYTNLNVIADKPPTNDKITRVNSISAFAEAGRIYLLQGGWNDSFIFQCTNFPNARHDDEVDCLCMAINKLEGSGRKLFRVGNL